MHFWLAVVALFPGESCGGPEFHTQSCCQCSIGHGWKFCWVFIMANPVGSKINYPNDITHVWIFKLAFSFWYSSSVAYITDKITVCVFHLEYSHCFGTTGKFLKQSWIIKSQVESKFIIIVQMKSQIHKNGQAGGFEGCWKADNEWWIMTTTEK